jgi:putative membrane protein insertion efficiency factor
MDFRFEKRIASFILSGTNIFIKSIFIIPRGSCRFSPSCSDYAQDAIKKFPLHIALIKIIIRIIRCNPFSKGGFDPV